MENITLETALDAFNVKDVAGMSDIKKKALQQAAEILAQGPDEAVLEQVQATLDVDTQEAFQQLTQTLTQNPGEALLEQIETPTLSPTIKSVQNASGVIDTYAERASAVPGAIKEKATDAASAAQGSIEKATEIVEPMPDKVVKAQQDEAGFLDKDEEQKTNQITNKNQSSSESSADKTAEHDQKASAACTICESLDPCIEKVVVTCHAADGMAKNTRVTLEGKYELEKTNGKIYFVAEKFENVEPSIENFMKGARLSDPTEIEITIKGGCPHGYHTVHWTNPEDGVTKIGPGKTTLKFRPETKPFPSLFTVMESLYTNTVSDYSDKKPAVVFQFVLMIMNLLIRRDKMASEDYFYITGDGTRSFAFTSVTVPLLKIRGNVLLGLSNRRTEKLTNQKERHKTKKQVRTTHDVQKIDTDGFKIASDITISVGNFKDTFQIGDYDRETKTFKTKISLKDENNKKNKKSGLIRFLSVISDSGRKFAGTLTSDVKERGKKGKVLSCYFEGPEVQLAFGPDQAETKGSPELAWNMNVGVSLYFKFVTVFSVYEALKNAARNKPPEGTALVLFLEELERGWHLGVAEGQINPALDLELSFAIEPRPSQAGPTDDFLSFSFDFLPTVQCNNYPEGQITGTASLAAKGGITGYFDSIFTKKTVFDYSAEIVTVGGITIKYTNNALCYKLWHNGVVLHVIGVKQIAKEDSIKAPLDNGLGRSAKTTTVVQKKENKKWVEDRSRSNSYRLAGKMDGEFVPFG